MSVGKECDCPDIVTRCVHFEDQRLVLVRAECSSGPIGSPPTHFWAGYSVWQMTNARVCGQGFGADAGTDWYNGDDEAKAVVLFETAQTVMLA